MNILDRVSGLVSRSTGLILLLTIVLTALAATRIVDPVSGDMRLEIDPSANRLLAENNQARVFYDHVRRTFGNDETLVITLTSDNIFTADNFRRIDRITRRIDDLEAVHHVASLTNALDIRSIDDGLDIAPFIENITDDPVVIADVRRRVLGNPIYAGSLVSKAGDATALIVHFLDITDRQYIRSGLHAEIQAILEEERGYNTVWLTGAPHFKVAIIEILIHDLVWTPPVIALILAIVLAIAFRTVLGVVAPLLTVGFGVIISLGLITALGYSLSMISVLVPPLLKILGLSYSCLLYTSPSPR